MAKLGGVGIQKVEIPAKESQDHPGPSAKAGPVESPKALGDGNWPEHMIRQGS